MAEKRNTLGSWSFLVGIILAIVIALIGPINEWFLWILVVIGILVGLLNVGEEEVTPFLMSGAVLIIASFFGQEFVSISPLFGRLLDAILLIFVPATIIVAIKNVFTIARR